MLLKIQMAPADFVCVRFYVCYLHTHIQGSLVSDRISHNAPLQTTEMVLLSGTLNTFAISSYNFLMKYNFPSGWAQNQCKKKSMSGTDIFETFPSHYYHNNSYFLLTPCKTPPNFISARVTVYFIKFFLLLYVIVGHLPCLQFLPKH